MKKIISFVGAVIIFNSLLSAQWHKVEQINSEYVYSALFVDNDFFIGGDSLYISRDRGLTWQSTTLNGQAIEITALFKFDSKIFAGTYGNGVYRSTDNGNSWQPYNAGLSGFALYAKKFVNSSDTIFYGSDGGGIYYLTPDSNQWLSYNENLPDNIAYTTNDIAVTSVNLILSAGASGFYYLRSKGSGQWTEKRLQTQIGSFITPNTFLVMDSVVFLGSRFGIYRSSDYGNSWDSVGIRALPLNVVSFTKDNNRIYAGFTRASDFFIWYSDDLGETWNVFDHQFHFLIKLFIYDNKIWAATNDGLWFRELETSSVNPIKTDISFILYQNYPNPFNPLTTIKFLINSIQFVTLKVYDMLGNEIAMLVDKEMPAGTYEIEFNPLSGTKYLASGFYLYQLRVGNYVQTKKMILMK